MTPRSLGILLVALAALLWSTAGLFVRVLDLDLWTMLAWRSLFAALALGAIAALQARGRALTALRALGWPGLVAVLLSAASMLSFVAALKLTTVANVMVVYATVPFLAAAIAWAWTGERPSPRAAAASGAALLGVLVMAGAATGAQDLLGNLLAFTMTASFAVILVMAKRYPAMQLPLVNALAAVIAALLCWPMAAGGVPEAGELVVLALFGVTTTGLAYLLFLMGGRRLPAGEAGLIGLLDVVLAPLWVWLAFAERPGAAALAGGALVLLALGWHLAGGTRPGGEGGARPWRRVRTA